MLDFIFCYVVYDFSLFVYESVFFLSLGFILLMTCGDQKKKNYKQDLFGNSCGKLFSKGLTRRNGSVNVSEGTIGKKLSTISVS